MAIMNLMLIINAINFRIILTNRLIYTNTLHHLF